MFYFAAFIVLVAAAAFAYLYLNNPDKEVEEPKLPEMTDEEVISAHAALGLCAQLEKELYNSGFEAPKPYNEDGTNPGGPYGYTIEYTPAKPKKSKKKAAKKKAAKKKPAKKKSKKK